MPVRMRACCADLARLETGDREARKTQNSLLESRGASINSGLWPTSDSRFHRQTGRSIQEIASSLKSRALF